MSDKVRVRFAPSPTGHLHIGGARTALFNWLYARHSGGTFILRIEDTDRGRSTEEYIEGILEGMRWLGLNWDEGPFRQTDRFDIYRKYVDRLLEEKHAYYCYCSPDELERRREEALARGLQPKYDGRCRDLKEPVPGVVPSVRFRMPQTGQAVVDDLVKGKVVFDNGLLDDIIVMRSDGSPTYNFVVVVDDVEMGITHVIRGDDHLNNTPKQIHVYNTLGYKTPVFAHLPMILGPDKTRLSKRHGATSVMAYGEDGFLADALINYLARLGWSHGDQEIFSREELIKYFTFENVGKSAAVFNPEKLLWLNGEYIRSMPSEGLSAAVRPFLVRLGTIEENAELDAAWLSKAVDTLRERCKTLLELALTLRYYIVEDVDIEPAAKEKFINAATLPYLMDIREGIKEMESLTHDKLEGLFKDLAQKHGVKLGAVAQPVRVAITGRTESPGIFEVLEVIGRDKALKRLNKAITIAGGEAV